MQKEDLNIVFMGTPEFAVESLDKIVKNGYNVTGVVTAPDKPAGRGRKIKQSEVKKYAVEQNLKVLQPTNLKSEEFIQELKGTKANVFIVVAFRMLPEIVWQIPKYGTINLHASLLPNYRGAAPINWAIINGEKTTGVTTFFIEKEIDTGKIILSDKEEITPFENAGTLHDKLMERGADLLLKTIQNIIDGSINPTSQTFNEKLKAAPKLTKDICKINWSDDVKKIYNKIRGLSPYPTAWTIFSHNNSEENMKIYDANPELINHSCEPGSIKTDNKSYLKIAASNGYITIKKLQLPGKKPYLTKDFLNGFNLNENSFFI
jgi:methionyl-tRNA formyltransferase